MWQSLDTYKMMFVIIVIIIPKYLFFKKKIMIWPHPCTKIRQLNKMVPNKRSVCYQRRLPRGGDFALSGKMGSGCWGGL